MPKNRRNAPVKKGFPLWAWGAIALVVVAAVVAGVLLSSKPANARLPLEVTVSDASQMRSKGAFILDVREQSEWNQFHIPGATLIPLGDLPNRLSDVPKDRDIVVVCRTGNRSATGRDILLKAGYPKVTSMAGGVSLWQTQGLPIATGQ
jgi:rhodanese-related sulfurtransferase